MQPTTEVLARIRKDSISHGEEVFTRLYRYLLRPDIYFLAYKHLYANNGAGTKGVSDDTADGFSEKKIERIIDSLKNDTYQPSPVRRTYIEKKNNPAKKRPLGIPTFTDKLVQEVLRMILEAVYEPVFLDCSHGFRPNRSCHTALRDLKHQFHGTRWFVEGDIKGCFDNIDHAVLISVIGKKIKDARLIRLIYKFLKAGYMEDWRYNQTFSGTPQGGIISPLLANIYLHELDQFVMTLKSDFDKPAEKHFTYQYGVIQRRMKKLKAQAETAEGQERENLIREYKQARKELLKTPCKSQTDKVIKYIRYADDFLIGVNGTKEEAEWVKQQLASFISTTLKMELSQEKTLITHSNSYARFLGYDVRVRRDNKKLKPGGASHKTRRSLSNMTELCVPFNDKIRKFLFAKGIVEQKADGTLFPVHRKPLVSNTDLEIVMTYNSELRGICNYYSMASNFCKLSYFAYLMEYSCLKTLAAKHKSTRKRRTESERSCMQPVSACLNRAIRDIISPHMTPRPGSIPCSGPLSCLRRNTRHECPFSVPAFGNPDSGCHRLHRHGNYSCMAVPVCGCPTADYRGGYLCDARQKEARPAMMDTESFDDLRIQIAAMASALDTEGAGSTVTRIILENAAVPVHEQMKQNASKDPQIISGALHGAINIGRVRKRSQGGKYITIGVHRKDWSEEDYYPAYVEYGHGGPGPAPSHPYIRPAYDVTEDEAYELIRDGLREALDRLK